MMNQNARALSTRQHRPGRGGGDKADRNRDRHVGIVAIGKEDKWRSNNEHGRQRAKSDQAIEPGRLLRRCWNGQGQASNSTPGPLRAHHRRSWHLSVRRRCGGFDHVAEAGARRRGRTAVAESRRASRQFFAQPA